MQIKLIPGTCRSCRFFDIKKWLCSNDENVKRYFVAPGGPGGIGQSEEDQCPLWQMIVLKFCVLNGHGWYPERDGCIHCQEEARMRSLGKRI